jgi:protein involved in polysaccharide export with SLBB domain
MIRHHRRPNLAFRLFVYLLIASFLEAPWIPSAFAEDRKEMKESLEESFSPRVEAMRPDQPIPLQHPVNPDQYVVGVGDQLMVHFWGQRDENIPLIVGPEGQVFLPNIGTVRASGKTLAELKGSIRWLLKKNYPGLHHDVFLVKPRTFRLHVLGQVERPGPMEANAVTHVSEVVEMAGFKSSICPPVTEAAQNCQGRPRGIQGSTRAIEVWRNGEMAARADLLMYQRFARIEDNPYVLDNDRIVVPYAGRMVRVSGAVRSPDLYELLDDETLHDLIVKLCGGPSRDISYREKAWIVRRGRDDQLHTIEFNLSELLNNPALSEQYPLKDGDMIKIPSMDRYQKLVRVEGAVFGVGNVAKGVENSDTMGQVTRETSGLYPVVLGERVSDLIEKAGGTMPWADLDNAYIERVTDNPGRHKIPIDLNRILVEKDFSADIAVEPGDRIVIPTTDDQIYVTGAVVKPGPRSYLTNYKAQNYVNMAGGPTTRASMVRAKIVHPDGEKEKYDEMTILKPGDTVHVPEKTFKFWQDYWTVLTGLATMAIAGYAVYAASENGKN